MITYTFNLDVVPGGVPVIVPLTQYEDDFTLQFRMFSSQGDLSLPSGTTVAIRGMKPDGNGYSVNASFNPTPVDFDDGTVTVDGDIQMTAAAGKSWYELVFKKNGETLCTARFVLAVERAAMDQETFPSESVIKELIDVIDRTDEIIEAAEMADDAINEIREITETWETTLENEVTGAVQSMTNIATAAQTAMSQQVASAQAEMAEQVGEVEGIADQMDAKVTQAQTAMSQQVSAASQTLNQKVQSAEGVLEALVSAAQATIDLKVDEVQAGMEDQYNQLMEVQLVIDGKVDGAYVEDGYLYLTSEDEVVAGPLGPFSGGGGGGGSFEYTITLQNLSESRTISAAEGGEVSVEFSYESVDDDEQDDGPGVGTISVNGVYAGTVSVEQGENEVRIDRYLSTGVNRVKITVENSEGNTRSLTYTVNIISLSITTTMSSIASYSGSVIFNYTPIGAGEKTIHFIMDGVEADTEVVSTSGRSRSYTIPVQSHGGHIFECYATMTIDGIDVTSNRLKMGMLFVDPDSANPAVLVMTDKTSVQQGENVRVDYMVHNPGSETTQVTLRIKDAQGAIYRQQQVTVDRSPRTWNVQDYPIGNIKFGVECGSVVAERTVAVEEYVLPVQPVTDGLVLEFDPSGRSNEEENPAQWSYGSISASFEGFGWSAADGWLSDTDGSPVLRFLPGDEMNIALKPFASDARATGYTIEVEMATRDVRDYESVVLDCESGGRGISILSQEAELTSEQSQVSMLFKEDSRVRVTFVIEQQTLNRLVYIYINGIMCGATQYPTNDDFSQPNPVNIVIGCDTCGIDLYKIRCYNKGLTRGEQLDNFICDRSTLAERKAAVARNDILNQSEEIVVNKLPVDLPYMIISCEELPQFKGDKKTGVTVTFVDKSDTSRGWVANGVELDVQGTSSAGYPVKNEKIKLKQGITWTESGETEVGFPISEGAIPTKTICLKVDYASSEGCNNVMLVDLYNEVCPYKTLPQQSNPKVRQGVEGFACALFWQNSATSEVTFVGKGNINVDKSNSEIFGFTEGFPAARSWEFLNNTSNRTLFKTSDFTTGWTDDFEARYPEDSTDFASFKRLTDWIVSTNRDVTGLTDQQKAQRLAKFKSEASDYLAMDAILFYYLFTEVFLMVDSRAKNMFMTTYDGVHWFSLPYDMDTAIGINNEGALVFDYDLEDYDQVGGANVFNGQDSVLWKNVRDVFADELKTMYTTLRSSGKFSYEVVRDKMADHQSVWPEALWNEDAFLKYLQPYLLKGENYLSMLQGSKSSQRDWWLFNAFRYRDSKYQCGDASSNFITLRCYAVGNITVTPYSHIWPRVKYGSYTAFTRGKRNQSYEMVCDLDTMDDTEVYIYSADRISSVGSLSHLKVGYANFSMATKLQSIILGSHASGYTNPKLEELYVGNNELLTLVNIENCTNLTMPIDLSGCASLETVEATGSAITGVNLPNGGHVSTLKLPGTLTNFTIQNQKELDTLTFAGYSALATLRVENTPGVDLETIINSATNLNRVRLVGVEWDATSSTTLQTTINKLKTCIGMDAEGGNVPHAVVNGRVNVSSITGTLLADIAENFPELVVVVSGVPQYVVRFVNWDNSLLYTMVVAEGGNAHDPVPGEISAPTRTNTDTEHYSYTGWSNIPTNVHANVTVVAQYTTQHRVRYLNYDSTVLKTYWVTHGQNVSYSGSTPTKPSTAQYTYTFSGWLGNQTNVTEARDIEAQFTQATRTYTVYFYNGTTLLQTVQNVPYGGSASYTGSTPVDPSGEGNPFDRWEPAPTNITGTTSCYAQFESPFEVVEITDSWDTIIANIHNGTYASKYKLGNYKPMDITVTKNNGTQVQETIRMQLVGKDTDDLSDGSGKAATSWISADLLRNLVPAFNPYPTTTVGGYKDSSLRSKVDGDNSTSLFAGLPNNIKSAIVQVKKTHYSTQTGSGSSSSDLEWQTTDERLWVPGYWTELNDDQYNRDPRLYKHFIVDYGKNIEGGRYLCKKRTTDTSYQSYIVRDVYRYNASKATLVNKNATYTSDEPSYGQYICIGFCI